MENKNRLKPLPPFAVFCQKVIPLVFDESLSYYELLCAILYKIKNEIIPAINNNAEAIEELQMLMKQLQEYVDNYFNNLDVQEEINNKLDEMFANGQFEQLFTGLDNILFAKRPDHGLERMNFDGTDETEKLQAMIDWGLANGGCTILLPAGSTRITNLIIKGHGQLNIRIIGQGSNTILYSDTDNNDTMFDIITDDETIDINNVVLENFAMIRDTTQVNVTALYCEQMTNDCRIENLYIKGFGSGLETKKCWTLKVLNNNFYQMNDDAVKITTQCHNLQFRGNKVGFNYNRGLVISSSFNVTVDGNDIEGNRGHGIEIFNTRNLSIVHNYIENNGNEEPTLYNEIFIRGNTIETSITKNLINQASVNVGILVQPSCENIDISHNIITGGNANKLAFKFTGNNLNTNGIVSYNSMGSFGSKGLEGVEIGNCQIIYKYETPNQIYERTGNTMYHSMLSSNGGYCMRLGTNGAIKLEFNYLSDGTPIINRANGVGGSESYSEAMRFNEDLGVQVRKYIAFTTRQTTTDITNPNTIFVAENGQLCFVDKDGVKHNIQYQS